MKKLSSVFYMWFGFGFGVIAVLSMFLPFIRIGSGIKPATYFFWTYSSTTGGFTGDWSGFVGYMFMLIGAIFLGVMGLPIKPSYETEKKFLISAFVLLVIGVILVGLIPLFWSFSNTLSIREPHTGYYMSVICGLIACVCPLVAVKLDA